MSQSAQVQSLDLLTHLHDVLARFGVTAQECLCLASAEVRHVHEALDERLRYWRQQTEKRHEDVARARAALSFARATNKGQHAGCEEEELTLRKAQERLRYAEEKVATVKRWQRELPELTKDFEARTRTLAGFLDSDLRRALVLLQNKVNTLEAYLSPPPSSAAPAPAAKPVTQPPTKEPS
jgi:small-conductance mechanosensitive channel